MAGVRKPGAVAAASGRNHDALGGSAVDNKFSKVAAALVADWPELSQRQRSLIQTMFGGDR